MILKCGFGYLVAICYIVIGSALSLVKCAVEPSFRLESYQFKFPSLEM